MFPTLSANAPSEEMVPQTSSHSSKAQKSRFKLQLPRPQTRPAWQTEHTGREKDHILRIWAVVIAADALHRRYDHHDRQTSGMTIRSLVVP